MRNFFLLLSLILFWSCQSSHKPLDLSLAERIVPENPDAYIRGGRNLHAAELNAYDDSSIIVINGGQVLRYHVFDNTLSKIHIPDQIYSRVKKAGIHQDLLVLPPQPEQYIPHESHSCIDFQKVDTVTYMYGVMRLASYEKWRGQMMGVIGKFFFVARGLVQQDSFYVDTFDILEKFDADFVTNEFHVQQNDIYVPVLNHESRTATKYFKYQFGSDEGQLFKDTVLESSLCPNVAKNRNYKKRYPTYTWKDDGDRLLRSNPDFIFSSAGDTLFKRPSYLDRHAIQSFSIIGPSALAIRVFCKKDLDKDTSLSKFRLLVHQPDTTLDIPLDSFHFTTKIIRLPGVDRIGFFATKEDDYENIYFVEASWE
mgnify:CR=1 FL=1